MEGRPWKHGIIGPDGVCTTTTPDRRWATKAFRSLWQGECHHPGPQRGECNAIKPRGVEGKDGEGKAHTGTIGGAGEVR